MAAHPRLLALLAKLDISVANDPDAQEQAQRLAQSPNIDDGSLVDRRALAFCTIDEPESKDLDQALYVEALDGPKGGGHRVWYAIADAAHFVKPGTPLWKQALARGSSYYLPGLVIPMLPRELSEGVVSLNPNCDRRSLLFVVDLDSEGRVQNRRIERARIRSRAKLSYQGVQAWYDKQSSIACDSEVQSSLHELAVVGRRRIVLALERGVVPFRRREVDLEDAEGRIVAYEDMRRDVERYSEQISLLCNVEGARFLREDSQSLHPIYRVHPAPAQERLDQLHKRIEQLIQRRNLDAAIWGWDGRADTFADWLAKLPRKGELGRIAEVIHRQAVVSSGRAGFTSTPGVHHGVGADVYGRFTAPMREVVGVYLHGEACEKIQPDTVESLDDEEPDRIRDEVISAAERAANHQKALDREANRIVIDQIVTQDLAQGGKTRNGTLMGMSRRKLHVRLEEPPLDVKVYLHHIEAQRKRRLSVDRDFVQLMEGPTPLLTLGDRVSLLATGKDPDADRWIFEIKSFS